MRLFLYALVFLFCAPCFGATAHAVQAQFRYGTGIYISQAGKAPGTILTNDHVVDGCSEISVGYPDGQSMPATPFVDDKADDLALLTTKLPGKAQALFSTKAKIGQAVAVFGFPLSGILSSGGNFTTGTIAALDVPHVPHRLQMSNPIQPGNSGGPLLNRWGEVIGIVELRANPSQIENVGVAIKASTVLTFLQANSVPYSPSHRILPEFWSSVATKAQQFTVRIACEVAAAENQAPPTPPLQAQPTPPPQTPQPSTITWRFTNSTPYLIQIKFATEDSSWVWPGNAQAYILNDALEHTIVLSVPIGLKVCYSAWTLHLDNTLGDYYWGRGHNNDHACSDCCVVSPGIASPIALEAQKPPPPSASEPPLPPPITEPERPRATVQTRFGDALFVYPSMDSRTPSFTVSDGAMVELVSCNYRYMGDAWCLIRYQGRQGYARGAYLVPVTGAQR